LLTLVMCLSLARQR